MIRMSITERIDACLHGLPITFRSRKAMDARLSAALEVHDRWMASQGECAPNGGHPPLKLRRCRATSTRSSIGRVNPAASDVDRARELLETAKLQNISDRMLAAAQVHATLAVERAVRELIAKFDAGSDH